VHIRATADEQATKKCADASGAKDGYLHKTLRFTLLGSGFSVRVHVRVLHMNGGR
jgi:hypothetical protein